MKKTGIRVLATSLLGLAVVAGAATGNQQAGNIVTSANSITARYTNHLGDAYSPYLRQHMHNPVDWYPWGNEALNKARAENKPVLVSIGYSTCYWCHVLEREVFSDKEVARFMNDNFVSIKVDREVRPDIDDIYMMATQMMTGSGGWPNNVLLTPDLKPFFAATYLPRDRWMAMLQQVSAAWSKQRAGIDARAEQANTALQHFFQARPPTQASLAAGPLADKFYSSLKMSYDSRSGGFGTGTKFPQEANLLFLLDYARADQHKPALTMVEKTVEHMIAGGIHDQVGGGFHRYATDPEWRVPHFEKMLYNQGQMANLLAALYARTGKPEYKRTLTRLVDFVTRDMTADTGAFDSAWDAETEAVEGALYVWNKSELQQALDEDDDDFLLAHFGFSALPHFPGHKYPDGEVLYQQNAIDDKAAWHRLDGIFAKLLAVRTRREPPLRDDKIVVAWNGIMIQGLANAGRILDNLGYLRQAEKAARFILDNMRDRDGRLSRIYLGNQPHQDAFLDDYAWLCRGLMALYRATGNDDYKKQTLSLIATADSYLLDANSGSYYLADGRDKLPVRIRQGMDTGALPSGNSVMAHVFVDLYRATNDEQWKHRAASLIATFGAGLSGQTASYGHLIYALSRLQANRHGRWPDPAVTTAEKDTSPPSLELVSSDKVKVHTQVLHNQSTALKKLVEVTIDIEDGWHLNANPASLDMLIPTVADIQTDQPSTVEVSYPQPSALVSRLGKIDILEGQIRIEATVTASQPIAESKLRLLLQVQACKEATCYPPSQISMRVLQETH